MAQKKNNTTKKSAGGAKSGKKGNKRNNQNSLFRPEHRMLIDIIAIFFSVFMLAVVYIDGGNIWAALRNFFFGVYGITAFIAPFFIGFTAIMALTKKDTRGYKQKVAEAFVIFILVLSLCHVVRVDSSLTYGEQIADAYNVFKNYNGSGEHYGFGVLGALVGGIPLLITGGSKLAAGVVVVLFLVAFILIFYGTTVFSIVSSLKKPAKAVGEYAEEKYDSLKEAYNSHNQSEETQEKDKPAKKLRRKKVVDDEPEEVVYPSEEVPATDGDEDYVNYDRAATLLYESLEEQRMKQAANSKVDSPSDYVIPLDDVVPEPPVIEDVFYSEPEEVAQETVDDSVTVDVGDFEEPETDKAVSEPIKYELPPIDCLELPKNSGSLNNEDDLRRKGETIVKTLQSFGVGTRIVEICQSPSVTRFELQPEPGVKISRITNLADDIAMNLAASGVRIEAPIPNKNAVGIEVPNAVKAMVTLREIVESSVYKGAKSKLNVALGRDIQGVATCADLAKMPHLLVAGTTGSGKSVCLNTMIMSLLYNATPEEVKLIMIDPKKVEFTVYRQIPHLLVPVVSDARKAAGALSWAVAEMDKRYALFADNGVRNLQGYNNYAEDNGIEKMPQIVIIIDELADLMMAASKEVEDSICRLAQKARAAGMHLIVATQRPSVDVITGLIKANIPSRIAFAVKSQIDSRTIIDTQGAEQLLGNGDMLFCPVGLSKPVRVQGCYVSDEEIERVIDFVTSQGEVKYDDTVMQEIELKSVQDSKKKGSAGAEVADTNGSGYDDELFPEAVELILELGNCSTTMIQRKLRLGYSRAGRITDELYEKGFIGPPEGAKPRKVLITKEQWYQMQANSNISSPKQLSMEDMAKPVDSPVSSVGDSPNYFGSAVNTDNYEVGGE